ncbi:hypothetical protein LADH09A_002219 [Micromonospora sp. LAH09]|uniref:hypothetical protein n=1 Tax=Micromonospora cabrerizensis TaxID=2911213 RepID=UPI001EE90505|nr:hypothetical protein [Micromonospora cabrerizensis]MCG5468359.1 hypothetical protein [Micromonospora cabrerizensis]
MGAPATASWPAVSTFGFECRAGYATPGEADRIQRKLFLAFLPTALEQVRPADVGLTAGTRQPAGLAGSGTAARIPLIS